MRPIDEPGSVPFPSETAEAKLPTVEPPVPRTDETLSECPGAPPPFAGAGNDPGWHRPGDRYVPVRFHDEGGMGRVWVAQDVSLGRDVALKELLPKRAADPSSRARFLREAQITSRLQHPGIVPVYELVTRPGDPSPFYIMRFIRGRTLTEAVRDYHEKRRAGADTALDLAALLHAFVVVCNTIGYAHSRGVIHRDLKGRNVVLGDFGEVVVLDWGLAKLIGDAEVSGVGLAAEGENESVELTQPGQVLGTPAYMAPEQTEGDPDRIDTRTDVYGLGAILYEILTERPPFLEADKRELRRKVREEPPVPPREICPDVHPGLEAVCLRTLAKRPEDRYAEAKDVAEAVQQWQEAERRKAEEALRASEERYRLLADSIPQNLWTAGPDGRLDYVNRRGADYHGTGKAPEAIEGERWHQFVHPEDLPRCVERWAASLRTGETYEIEFRLRGSDGAYRWYLARAMPLRDAAGRIVKWYGSNTDIDDRKNAEQALAATATELARCRAELEELQRDR